jgi:hypothetical protein
LPSFFALVALTLCGFSDQTHSLGIGSFFSGVVSVGAGFDAAETRSVFAEMDGDSVAGNFSVMLM